MAHVAVVVVTDSPWHMSLGIISFTGPFQRVWLEVPALIMFQATAIQSGQASAFAGEFLMGHNVIQGLSPAQIAQACGVSYAAACYQYRK